MNHTVSELDLLALIEGTLPTDRVEAVRAALTADPVLLRRVELLVRDRERLKREGRAPIPVTALTGLVAQAIAEAERDALLAPGSAGSSARSASGRPSARRQSSGAAPVRRRAPMLIAAGLGVGMLGVVGFLILQSVGPEGVRRERPMITSKVPEGGSFAVATDSSMPEIVGPPAIFHDPDAEAAEVQATIMALVEARAEAEKRAAEAPDTEQPADTLAAKSAPSIRGMSLDDAVVLARAGRLRLVVANTDRHELSSALSILASASPPAGAPEPLRFDRTASDAHADPTQQAAAPVYTVRIGMSSGTTGDRQLREQLMAAVDRLIIVSGSDVEFQAVPPDAPTRAHGPRPALTAANLLWWGEPTSAWTPRLELAIPVDPGH